MSETNIRVKIIKNGPYNIKGGVPLDELEYVSQENGASLEYKKVRDFDLQEEYNLCRCGKSKKKPYCDGSHVGATFNGDETTSNTKYLDMAKFFEGEEVDLLDAEEYCTGARFCDAYNRAWDMIINPQSNEETVLGIGEAKKCPGGRLVAIQKDGKMIESKFERGISLLRDKYLGVNGPIQIKGGIPIVGGDGKLYEVRNRVTLCRCGNSMNKPFCDGSHIQEKYENNGL